MLPHKSATTRCSASPGERWCRSPSLTAPAPSVSRGSSEVSKTVRSIPATPSQQRSCNGYLGTLPAVAALPLVPQSTPPLGVGRAELHALPASVFFPVLPV